MTKLKNIFVYNNRLILTLLILLILYTKSIFILLLSFIYIIYRLEYKYILGILVIILIILVRIYIGQIDTKYYYVKSINNNKIIISNYLNDIVIYQNLDLKLDEIVKINKGLIRNNDINKLKNNINYTYNGDVYKVSEIKTIRNITYNNFVKLEDSRTKEFIAKILFGEINYDNEDSLVKNISFSHYFIFKIILNLIKKSKIIKNIHIPIVSMVLINIFGINFNTIRIIVIETLYSRYKQKDKALSYAILLMIIYNPFSIYSYSFIIPFLLRLIFIFRNSLDFKVIMMIIQSYFFNQINPFSIIFYSIYMNIMSFVILLSTFLLISNLTISPISFFYDILDIINPLLSFRLNGKLSLIIIIWYILFIVIFKIKNKSIQILIIILLITCNISNIFGSITYIDIGQGDAILIRTPFNKENILIDTGPINSYYKLERELNAKGVYNIDYLIITHKDKDHSGNIKSIYKNFNVIKTITEPVDVITNSIILKSLNNTIYNNVNDSSLVYALNYDGYNFLFTGDISTKIEEDIINKYPFLRIDVLKLSHHGSKSGTSDRLLNNFDIKFAIASTSGMYNHPHIEVINKLNKYNIPLYTTKEKGTISFYFTKLFDFIKCNSDEFVIIK